MTEEAKKLYREIKAFTLWADNNFPMWDEEHDNGEWEIGTDNHFDEMVSAAGEVISNTDFADADEGLIDAMLFVVARDNESEILADELLKHEGWFTLLAKSSLGSKYVNAQWQFAKRIGEIEECKTLVYDFIKSDHEYTSRMALDTMADIYQDKAEEYAVLFWDRGKYPEGSYEDEYQKIMTLHVLHRIGSMRLEEYLDKAMLTSYKYLKENAEEIRKQKVSRHPITARWIS